ncbi:MAG: RQC domain-containing protein [Chitinophagales bacterium]|nr:RQC domain-containing protein [Chitinophagales bacterium]
MSSSKNISANQNQEVIEKATLMAQKALSAIARLNEEVETDYVIDFLRGSKSEKIRELHKQIKTFGAGVDSSRQEWLNHIRDLISYGYLKPDSVGRPILKLTEKSWKVLRGEEKVLLATKAVDEPKVDTKGRGEVVYEPDLLEELIKLRKYFSKKEDTPAYMILSDMTLHELAAYLPQTKEEITEITGFGDAKVSKYASRFLYVIKEYCEINYLPSRMELKNTKQKWQSDNGDTDTKVQSLELFRQGIPVSEIARMRDLPAETIEGHLTHFIPSGEVFLTDLVAAEKIPLIKEAIRKMGGNALQQIKEMLGESYSYGEIRAVMSVMRRHK